MTPPPSPDKLEHLRLPEPVIVADGYLQWTPEEQEQIQQIARDTIPGIKTHGIPTGLQVKEGPEGVVRYLTAQIDAIMS